MLFNIIAVVALLSSAVLIFLLGVGFGALYMARHNQTEDEIEPVELVNHYLEIERPTTVSPRKVMEVVGGIGCCSTCSSEVVIGEVDAGTEFQCRCGAGSFITLPAPPPPVVVVATWCEVDEAPTSLIWDGVERRKNDLIEGKPWRAESREDIRRRG